MPTILKVCNERCAECLFSAHKIVSTARRKDLLEQCAQSGGAFLCHKGTIAHKRICCRGFYDTLPLPTRRMGEVMGLVEFVPVPVV